MMAGVPGTGIGGIFYLLSALLMPIKEISKTISGKSSKKRWQLVAMQMVLACGVMGGFCLTGWLLGVILADKNVVQGLKNSSEQLPNFFRMESLYFSLITLGTVIFCVQILYILSRLQPLLKSLKK